MKKIAAVTVSLLISAFSVSSAMAETASFTTLLDKSAKAMSEKDWPEGLAASRQLVALPYLTKANEAVAYTHLCINLSQMGRIRQALRACDQAVALDPEAWGAYINRGNVLLSSGYRLAARADFRRADELKPAGAIVETAAPMQKETAYVFMRPAINAAPQQALVE